MVLPIRISVSLTATDWTSSAAVGMIPAVTSSDASRNPEPVLRMADLIFTSLFSPDGQPRPCAAPRDRSAADHDHPPGKGAHRYCEAFRCHHSHYWKSPMNFEIP